MPYPNEHACRLNDPKKYTRFMRKNDVNPNVIIGFLPNGKSEIASYRYPVKDWTEVEASKHCAEHNGMFEPAAQKKSNEVKNMEQFEPIQFSEKKKWYLIIPRGKYEHPEYGTLDFSDEFFSQIIDNFNNKVLGETQPFIDINHDMGDAYGWIENLKVEEQGLFAEISWNDAGKEIIKQKKYKYFSPTIGDYTDPKSGETYNNVLRTVSLTNIPFLKDLPKVELKEKQINIKIMKEEGDNKMNEIVELLKKFEIEATEEDAMEKLAEFLTQLHEKNQEYAEKIKEFEAKLEEASKDEVPKEELSEKEELIKKLSEKVVKLEAQRDLSKAISDGKILPEKLTFWEQQYIKNPEGTKEIIENLPKIMDFKEKSVVKTVEKKELSEDDQKAMEIFQLTPEDFEKYGE